MITIFFYILSGLCFFGTALPLIPKDVWWIRIFDFPRLQIFSLTIPGIIYFVIYRSYLHLVIIIFLLLIAIYQFYHIYPYTPFADIQVKKSDRNSDNPTLSLLVANILMTNRNFKGFLRNIDRTDPDLILAVEVDKTWADAMISLDEKYPYKLSKPLDNTYGMTLYSKKRISEAYIEHLVEPGIPSFHGRIDLSQDITVNFHALHPRPPHPVRSTETTGRDAELLGVGHSIRNSMEPVVVMGDLNDVAWSYTTKLFLKLSGLLDPRVGRGLYNTFNAKLPILRWPLDHIFHSHHFSLRRFKRLKPFGSDHFPLYLELEFNHSVRQNNIYPEPVDEEMELIHEKIDSTDADLPPDLT